MKKRKRLFSKILWITSILFVVLIAFAFYSNSLIGVNVKTINYYEELKKELIKNGYEKNLIIISGKRNQITNTFLRIFGSAAKNSWHLKGEAIDVLVLDVNQDGISNTKDVDIVYNILDKKIVGDKGGIGTYKKKFGFFTKQMVHFDCRGYRARWNR